MHLLWYIYKETASALVSFPVAIIKRSHKSKLRERGLILALSTSIQASMARKSRQPVPNHLDCYVHDQEAEGSECMVLLLSVSS